MVGVTGADYTLGTRVSCSGSEEIPRNMERRFLVSRNIPPYDLLCVWRELMERR